MQMLLNILYWNMKAAVQGDARAQFSVGYELFKGGIVGVKKDKVTGMAWIKIGIGNGFPPKGISNPLIVDFPKEMTPEQTTKAEALVKEMIKKNPNLIQKKE